MSVASRPLPVLNGDTKPFWEACRRHELRVQRCRDCGTFRFPPLPTCPNCTSFESDWVKVSGEGTIYSFTVARHAVHAAFPAPYVIALVELEDAGGVRLTTRLIGCDPSEVSIGARVAVVFEDVDEQISLPLFRLIGEVTAQ